MSVETSKLPEKANDRLYLLRIIPAIFIPLTLVAGICGMNFRNMPELHWDYAYFGGVGAMLAIALAMLWGFDRSGWFRRAKNRKSSQARRFIDDPGKDGETD